MITHLWGFVKKKHSEKCSCNSFASGFYHFEIIYTVCERITEPSLHFSIHVELQLCNCIVIILHGKYMLIALIICASISIKYVKCYFYIYY